MKKIPEYWAAIVRPLTSNVALCFLLGGLVLLVLGNKAAAWVDGLPFVWVGTADIIAKIGAALIGAGVFSVILKSAQFTELFQQNIHDVFYRPDLAVGIAENKRKWTILTDSIFSTCLTRIHGEATEKIKQIFFSAELEYHFDNMELQYRIDLQGNILTVRVHTKSTIVISPNVQPVIVQRITANSGIKVVSVLVNQTAIPIKNFVKPVPNKPGEFLFELPYDEYKNSPSFTSTRSFQFERTIEYTQDITVEPFIVVGLTRFVSGLSVSAKAVGCTPHFARTGSGVLDALSPIYDGTGYTRWVLAKQGELLLPGQGYIIILTT